MFDRFFAPFGEVYNNSGTATASFTGKTQDLDANLYDFQFREESPVQGRWLNPDPASMGATQLSDPQTLNRYSYVRNAAMSMTDPLGLWGDGRYYDMFAIYGGAGNANYSFVPEWFPGYTYGNGSVDVGLAASGAGTTSEQNQGSGGFFQKLGNWLGGNGWKTNGQVISDQRQWLSDNKIVGRDAEGKEVPMDWSKASAQNVAAVYRYVHNVMAAANANHALSVIGIAATITFGHGARHLAGTGLKEADVNAAVERDINAALKNATQPTGNFWGRVNVGGKTVEYRAYTLQDGTIHVGTYYVP